MFPLLQSPVAALYTPPSDAWHCAWWGKACMQLLNHVKNLGDKKFHQFQLTCCNSGLLLQHHAGIKSVRKVQSHCADGKRFWRVSWVLSGVRLEAGWGSNSQAHFLKQPQGLSMRRQLSLCVQREGRKKKESVRCQKHLKYRLWGKWCISEQSIISSPGFL